MLNSHHKGLWHPRNAVTSRLRLRDHDYASGATYFVTVTTANRACLFGDMREGDVILNEAGIVIDSWWRTIPARFPDVILDAMVVMPNHVHGILSLGTDPDAQHDDRSLSDIIGWFKTRTIRDYGLGVRTRQWQSYIGKLWQPGYYDHVIRSDAMLEKVRDYIAGNPARWAEDNENPERRDQRPTMSSS